jgi:hypothetical protein
MTVRTLSGRLARLETSRASAALTVRDAIDRPPQETYEEWTARKAAELRGESYDSGKRNARGESFAQWVARRQRELDAELYKENCQ